MTLLAHLKYTFRQIKKNPGFSGIALAALALGIGANTAIFSAVEAMLLRPLPFMQPSRLVIVWGGRFLCPIRPLRRTTSTGEQGTKRSATWRQRGSLMPV